MGDYKFKIGDRVRLIKNPNWGIEIGDTGVVDELDTRPYVIWDKNNERWSFNENELELVDVVKTKDDLKCGDIVTLRNGDKLIYGDDEFMDLDDNNDNSLCDLDDLKDDLKYDGYKHSNDYDIIKVERPINFEIVYVRDETVREMTVEEISKALGYEVKIVKESD